MKGCSGHQQPRGQEGERRDEPPLRPAGNGGEGVDRGMLDDALAAVGPRRLLWACDVTMCTGLAKLRALDHVGLTLAGIADVRWRNAVRLFPTGSFPGLPPVGP